MGSTPRPPGASYLCSNAKQQRMLSTPGPVTRTQESGGMQGAFWIGATLKMELSLWEHVCASPRETQTVLVSCRALGLSLGCGVTAKDVAFILSLTTPTSLLLLKLSGPGEILTPYLAMWGWMRATQRHPASSQPGWGWDTQQTPCSGGCLLFSII